MGQQYPSNYVKHVWCADEGVTRCLHCSLKFTLRNRRHHCRACGQIFCESCTSVKVVFPERCGYKGPQRVCSACYRLFEGDLRKLIEYRSVHIRQVDNTRTTTTTTAGGAELLAAQEAYEEGTANSVEGGVFKMQLSKWRPLNKSTCLVLCKSRCEVRTVRQIAESSSSLFPSLWEMPSPAHSSDAKSQGRSDFEDSSELHSHYLSKEERTNERSVECLKITDISIGEVEGDYFITVTHSENEKVEIQAVSDSTRDGDVLSTRNFQSSTSATQELFRELKGIVDLVKHRSEQASHVYVRDYLDATPTANFFAHQSKENSVLDDHRTETDLETVGENVEVLRIKQREEEQARLVADLRSQLDLKEEKIKTLEQKLEDKEEQVTQILHRLLQQTNQHSEAQEQHTSELQSLRQLLAQLQWRANLPTRPSAETLSSDRCGSSESEQGAVALKVSVNPEMILRVILEPGVLNIENPFAGCSDIFQRETRSPKEIAQLVRGHLSQEGFLRDPSWKLQVTNVNAPSTNRIKVATVRFDEASKSDKDRDKRYDAAYLILARLDLRKELNEVSRAEKVSTPVKVGEWKESVKTPTTTSVPSKPSGDDQAMSGSSPEQE